MDFEKENYAKWKVRSKAIGFATWLGVALFLGAVVATYLVPDNTAKLMGFVFLILNVIASPFLIYLFVRTKINFKEAKACYDRAKQQGLVS